MALNFTKMHGLGNDFMVIDGVNQQVSLSAGEIQTLSARHTGVGFDQCLIIEASNRPDVDFFYRILNANGEPVGQCGNGARAIARFIAHYQLSNANPIRVATQNTRLSLQLNPTHTSARGYPLVNPAASRHVSYSPAIRRKLCYTCAGYRQSTRSIICRGYRIGTGCVCWAIHL
jgi:diaminopimelate epimerase